MRSQGAAPERAASAGQVAVDTAAPGSAAWVRRVRDTVLASPVPEDPAEQVDLLSALAELTSTLAAVQGTVALAVDATTRAREADDGVPARARGRGVPVEVALALRESPARARTLLGAARVWHSEMPHTLGALRSGHLTPWRAMVLVKETAHLPIEQRAQVDRELCRDPRILAGLGTRELTARVRRRAAELDPAAAVERARRAAEERSVWIRPAPDTMAYVTALLPVAQGVAAYAALRRTADAARAAGDDRSRGQVMADTFVERLTGQTTAEAVPVTVNLVVSDATLLGAGHEPAVVVDESGAGHSPVPAQVARELVAAGLDQNAAWLRTVYGDPGGQLVATTSVRRFFADGLAALLRVRDQGLCRTPYCDAPARHFDHVTAAAAGGGTEIENGHGLCEACNLAKEAPGWRHRTIRDRGVGGRHTVAITTPSGRTSYSTAPPPPRPARPAPIPIPTGDPTPTSTPIPTPTATASARGGADVRLRRVGPRQITVIGSQSRRSTHSHSMGRPSSAARVDSG